MWVASQASPLSPLLLRLGQGVPLCFAHRVARQRVPSPWRLPRALLSTVNRESLLSTVGPLAGQSWVHMGDRNEGDLASWGPPSQQLSLRAAVKRTYQSLVVKTGRSILKEWNRMTIVCAWVRQWGGLSSSFVTFHNKRHSSLPFSQPQMRKGLVSLHMGGGSSHPSCWVGRRGAHCPLDKARARERPDSSLSQPPLSNLGPSPMASSLGPSGSHSPNQPVLGPPTPWGSFLTADKVTLLECGVAHATPFLRVVRGLPPASGRALAPRLPDLQPRCPSSLALSLTPSARRPWPLCSAQLCQVPGGSGLPLLRRLFEAVPRPGPGPGTEPHGGQGWWRRPPGPAGPHHRPGRSRLLKWP